MGEYPIGTVVNLVGRNWRTCRIPYNWKRMGTRLGYHKYRELYDILYPLYRPEIIKGFYRLPEIEGAIIKAL